MSIPVSLHALERAHLVGGATNSNYVNKGPYDNWKDAIWVEYRRTSDTEQRILEGDVIRFYGDFKGLKTYKAVIGQSVTLPRVVAEIIERV